MAVDIFDREVAISRLALIQHAEHDTHTLCRSDTRFYDADETHTMSDFSPRAWHCVPMARLGL
jgi:hypothetical protein